MNRSVLARERGLWIACYVWSMRARLITAFAAVYLVWGSTYLAIRFAVETLPPLLMAGARFVLAGAIVLAWARFRERAPAPTRAEWRGGVRAGGLPLPGGDCGVGWAEPRVPSPGAGPPAGSLPRSVG